MSASYVPSRPRRSHRRSCIGRLILSILSVALISSRYNANVKELQDTPGSEYFAFLSRKAHEGALNQAKVDVAEGTVMIRSRIHCTKTNMSHLSSDAWRHR